MANLFWTHPTDILSELRVHDQKKRPTIDSIRENN